MLHMMAHKYGMLPSQVLREADTFDMMVFDVANTVEAELNKDKSAPDYDINDTIDAKELEANYKAFREVNPQ